MLMNKTCGANIPYPYKVPNKTQDDGTLGIWALEGATEVAFDILHQIEPDDKDKIIMECGPRREDEK